MLYYSLYYVALLGFLATVTNMWVITKRMKHKVSFGDGGEENLIRARSAHNNLLEFGVIFVLMLMAAEWLGMSREMVLGLGSAFFTFRLIHMYHMLSHWRFPSIVRIVGTAGSHTINLILMAYIIRTLFS